MEGRKKLARIGQMDSRSYWLGGWRDAKDDKQAGLYK